MDVCSGGGQPFWLDIAMVARSGLAIGALDNRNRIFCLGFSSAQHVASVLSALDAFWVCYEFLCYANRSRGSVLYRSTSVWTGISVTWERSDASKMES